MFVVYRDESGILAADKDKSESDKIKQRLRESREEGAHAGESNEPRH